MLNYIYHNYQNPITLSQISKVGKISIAQCYRDFKNIIKMSPYEYLIHYCFMKSIDYLLESFNITEISEKSRKRTYKILDILYYSNNSKTLI